MCQNSSPSSSSHAHFEGKDAYAHIAEVKAKGLVDQAESHATEPPKAFSVAFDSAKETAFVLMLVATILHYLEHPPMMIGKVLIIFSLGYMLWKTGRGGFLAWSRLERLDAMMEEERFEIRHHRQQEREELIALYSAKGFNGSMLERVVDVLMADENRLLKVMLEEEMGLSLGSCEHPLKLAVYAGLGSLFCAAFVIAALYIGNYTTLLITGFFFVLLVSFFSAQNEKNSILPTIVWNGAILYSVIAIVYKLLSYY